jgi:hypothetical protein
MMSDRGIALELLDSGQGYAIQRWEFEDVGLITIGRSKECDIVVANPFVSRSHAYVQAIEAEWRLVALSSAGVFVDRQRIATLTLADGALFRLAERGPLMRYLRWEHAASRGGGSTVHFDPVVTPLLVLHETERDREVEAIAESPYFQELQRQAARLRQPPS